MARIEALFILLRFFIIFETYIIKVRLYIGYLKGSHLWFNNPIGIFEGFIGYFRPDFGHSIFFISDFESYSIWAILKFIYDVTETFNFQF